MHSKLLLTVLLFILENNVSFGYREFDVDGVRTILSLENETINIQCETDMPMAYCGFVHPSGKRFSFSGSSLIDGHCSIKRNATKDDTGEWNCHIGKSSIGVEMKQRILVRVVDKLAAVQPNVSVVHGKEVTLFCATTKTLTPLSYCRFEPPNGSPFSIGADVTKTNAILGKYWFPQNKSLDRGDCAVTIRRVKYEDVGLWTCGAGLDDGKEYIDVILVEVQGLYTMSTASVTGVTFGVIGVILFLAILGFVAWKKRRVLGSGRVVDVQEMGPIQTRAPRRTRSPRGTRELSAEAAKHAIPQGSPKTERQKTQASPKIQRIPLNSPETTRASQGTRSPRGSPEAYPEAVEHATPQGSQKTEGQKIQDSSKTQGVPLNLPETAGVFQKMSSPRRTPEASPQAVKHATPQGSPKTERQKTPQASPKIQRIPLNSPKLASVIPHVIVQSPSEASGSSHQDEP